MAQFRPKRLDLGCFTNIKVIRDHTKRQVFEQNEPERYVETIARRISRDAISHRAMSMGVLT